MQAGYTDIADHFWDVMPGLLNGIEPPVPPEKYSLAISKGRQCGAERKKERKKNYSPQTITVSSKKKKDTILKLASSRPPEKQKAPEKLFGHAPPLFWL